jgi:hypothetical protein
VFATGTAKISLAAHFFFKSFAVAAAVNQVYIPSSTTIMVLPA